MIPTRVLACNVTKHQHSHQSTGYTSNSPGVFDRILCAGTFVGDVTALARISFGIDMGRNVAMKLVTRSESSEVSEAIHQIIQS